MDDTSFKGNWSIPQMIANRQIGLGARPGQFTQYEKCKIGNSYVPNKKQKTLMNLQTKVFCGTYSRDGHHFVTASQGINLLVYVLILIG